VTTHTCDKHTMTMKKGKNNFTNLYCKLCDKYIKHASHYEIKVYDWYYTNNEHQNLTVQQVIEEAQELKEETFKLDPEQYIDAFGENVIWLSVHYKNKELAKQFSARWEPRIKLWYTYVNNPQAIKLIEWMSEEDIERVQDYMQEQEEIQNVYKNIIDVRKKQLSIKRSEANIKQSLNTIYGKDTHNKGT